MLRARDVVRAKSLTDLVVNAGTLVAPVRVTVSSSCRRGVRGLGAVPVKGLARSTFCFSSRSSVHRARGEGGRSRSMNQWLVPN